MTTPVSFWRTGNIEGHMELLRRQVEKSLADPGLRALAVRITSRTYDYIDTPQGRRPVVLGWDKYFWAPDGPPCAAKDDSCELGDLWSFVVQNCRYVYDPDGTDLFATAKVSLIDGGGDCFPEGTQLLTSDYRLTPIEHLRAGQKIWGRDRWSEVGAVVPKGERAITMVRLNNGSYLRLTDDHKVYVAECPQHPRASRTKSRPCACLPSSRELLRIAVTELEPGMVLVQPESIETARGAGDPERAWLDGAFLAEGWVDGKRSDAPSRFAISGRDGKPKEATKHRVRDLLTRWGLGDSLRWHERYISINNAEMAQRFLAFGRGAENKRLPDLNRPRPEVRALLEGLLLDSSRNTYGGGRTFGSVSRQLAVQVRILARMLGMRTGWSAISNHGGLGDKPIYRVTLPAFDAEHMPKLLRVKEVLRIEGDTAMTWDLKTDDHFVYLPEHDVTVSNCDDSVIVYTSLARALGFTDTRARVVSMDGEEWVHTYPVIGCPKDQPKVLVPLDCTVQGAHAGWQVSGAAAVRDFPMF